LLITHYKLLNREIQRCKLYTVYDATTTSSLKVYQIEMFHQQNSNLLIERNVMKINSCDLIPTCRKHTVLYQAYKLYLVLQFTSIDKDSIVSDLITKLYLLEE